MNLRVMAIQAKSIFFSSSVSKNHSLYVCQSCGAQSGQFFGRCSSCGDWNSLVEQSTTISKENRLSKLEGRISEKRSRRIDSLEEKVLMRLTSGYKEFDRVLGGGLVPGSLILVGGDPGIGKSTLLLQSATEIAVKESVLYVSAEESAQQVRL